MIIDPLGVLHFKHSTFYIETTQLMQSVISDQSYQTYLSITAFYLADQLIRVTMLPWLRSIMIVALCFSGWALHQHLCDIIIFSTGTLPLPSFSQTGGKDHPQTNARRHRALALGLQLPEPGVLTR